MNNRFDELTKGMAQSVTRRSALKKFGVGLAGVVLTSLGLANNAKAGNVTACINRCVKRRCKGLPPDQYQFCYNTCVAICVQGG